MGDWGKESQISGKEHKKAKGNNPKNLSSLANWWTELQKGWKVFYAVLTVLTGGLLVNFLQTTDVVRETYPQTYYIFPYKEQQDSTGAITLFVPRAWSWPLGDVTLDQSLTVGRERDNPADLGPAITASDFNNVAWWKWWEKDSGVFLGASKALLYVTDDEIQDGLIEENDLKYVNHTPEDESPTPENESSPSTTELSNKEIAETDYALIDNILGSPDSSDCQSSRESRHRARPNADYTIRFTTWAGCGPTGPEVGGIEYTGFVVRPTNREDAVANDEDFVAMGRFKRIHAGDDVALEELFDRLIVDPKKIPPSTTDDEPAESNLQDSF